MQKIVLLFLLISINFSFSQENEIFNELIESEAKSASKIIVHKANINTANYDITYHKLEFTVDPAIAFINGIISTTFTAKSIMNTVTFDLSNNMTVSEVTQNGTVLNHSQSTNELVITLSQSLAQGQETTVKITYSGNPISSGFGSFEQATHNGAPIVWTLSEPYGAMGWWPCKQDLNDKIDAIDVFITAPKQYVSVSNGLEQGQVVTGSTKTTHFKHGYPIPAYLIAFAITNYEVYSHTVTNNGNPFDIVNYVYPEDLTTAQSQTGITVDIMNVFTELFGEYPFADEKYGHAQFGCRCGMEHTTVSFMGNFNRGLIAHELAHQWFGNKITCGSWKDIWLNESFATYLSGLTIENLDGNDSFIQWRESKNNSITSSPNGAVYLSDQDTTSVGRIFNGRLSYNKGSMVLHMLRRKLGDATFFQSLKNYLVDPKLAYGYAKTPDLITHFEAVNGENLTEFFKDWIYNQGYPSYSLKWFQQQTNQIKITLNQNQSDVSVSFFEAPVPVRVHGENGEILNLVLNNNSNGEEFTEAVTFKVTKVEIDPDSHLISKNNSVTLGIDDEVLASQFSVFPNPVTNELTVKNPNQIHIEKITIFNSLGQLERQLKNVNTINVSTLMNGLHFLRIQTEQGVFHKSFLKQ